MEQSSPQKVALSQIVEALLIASPQPLSTHEIVRMIRSAGESAKEELKAQAEAAAQSDGPAKGDESSRADESASDGRPADSDVDESGERESGRKGKGKGSGKAKGKGNTKVDGKEGSTDEPARSARNAKVASTGGAQSKTVKAAKAGAAEAFKALLEASDRPELDFLEVTDGEVHAAIESLVRDWSETGRAFTLLERAEGWRIYTVAALAPWVRHLFPERKPERLSAPALETLAIIAYRQPIAKSAIEAVRGVSVDGVLQKLLDRNIVRIAGRSELPGRPLLYETTELFFEHFGIRSVDDLPNAAELRAVALPEPSESTAPAGTEDADKPEGGGEVEEMVEGDGDAVPHGGEESAASDGGQLAAGDEAEVEPEDAAAGAAEEAAAQEAEDAGPERSEPQ